MRLARSRSQSARSIIGRPCFAFAGCRSSTSPASLADARAAFAAAAATGWPEDALTEVISQIIDHLEAQQTEASLRRGLADITAGRTVDLGSFAQPATAPPAAQQGDSGHRDGDEAARPKLNAQTAPSIPTDLTASQGETGHEDQYETDFDRWLSGIGPGQREQITRDIEAARDLIDRERHPEHMTYTPTTEDMQTAAGLAGWSTDEWREWYYTMRAEVRAQALREAASAPIPRAALNTRNNGLRQWLRARADRIERGE